MYTTETLGIRTVQNNLAKIRFFSLSKLKSHKKKATEDAFPPLIKIKALRTHTQRLDCHNNNQKILLSLHLIFLFHNQQ